MEDLKPKDHAEAIALYRSTIVGGLARRELARGELAHELDALSKQRFQAPRRHGSQSYGVSTLERWYYAYRRGGLEALRPRVRSDSGRGRVLNDEMRQLLLDIRDERPSPTSIRSPP